MATAGQTKASKDAATGTQSVERAFMILDSFSLEHPQRRISELVERTGLGQSTVSRLVGAMLNLGYLAIDERSGLYTVGKQVVTLASIVLNQSPVHRQARQQAQELAADLGLGVNVAERRGDRLFYLCNFEGRSAPRSATLAGRGGPLHSTGLGKVLISELDRHDLVEVLGKGPFPKFTARTITGLSELEDELVSVRERGYAMEVEELALRRACIAAPIRDQTGRIIAAMSISGPMSAMKLGERESELSMRVLEEVEQISAELRYGASL